LDFIQIQWFASIDSQALKAVPLGREAPEDPSAQTKTEIIGIFPFWAAYITNFYDFPAGQATRQISVRSGVRTEPNRPFGVRGHRPNRTEVWFAVREKAAPN
jgi:hypothetical protein